jgi:large subunit ribosomal protein L10
MNGEPLTAEQIADIARLPAKDVLHGQLVGVVASPITGLVRGLNALIVGLAVQLRQIAEQEMVPVGGAAPSAESPDEPDPAEADQAAQAREAGEEAARSSQGEETESSSEEAAPAGPEAAGEETEDTDTPSEGENE